MNARTDAVPGGFRNLLEPPGLVAHFLAHPPIGFAALTTATGTPAFIARFDLLTTADDALRARVVRWPGYRWWGRLLRPRTCFVGTTVSEYALFPCGASATALVSDLSRRHARRHPFLIVKDIPQQSPLLDGASNRFAAEVAQACEEAGFVMLEGQALAWVPIDFESTDEYLARLSPSRRKDIRRKLRARGTLDVDVLATGQAFADAALRTEMYALYREVFTQSDIHFDCLSRDFFDAVLQDADSEGRVFAYRRDGRLIGWNLCFVVGDVLVDKYVGFRYPAAREANLYFVSWFENLAYAQTLGLCAYVAGWTDPEIKAYLGARFTFTRHAVYPRSRLLRGVLRRVAGRFESDRAWRDARAGAQSETAATRATAP